MKSLKVLTFSLLFTISFSSMAQFGNMLYTDGIQDYIEVPDSDALDLVDDFTVECWVNAKVVDTLYIFRKGWCNDGGDDSYYLAIINGKVRWHWNETGSCNYSSFYQTDDSVVSPGKCVHIAVVHSTSDGISIYVNNELKSGSILSGDLSTVHVSHNSMSISAYRLSSGSYGFFYWGSVDEIRFWDYKLTQQEIIDYSSQPLNGDESGLLVYFDMEDEGVGDSLTITNKAINSGTITGQGHGSSTSPKFIKSCIVGTETQEIDKNKNDICKIYPNPVKDYIYIKEADKVSSIQIIDVNGRTIINTVNPTTKIDVSKLEKGVYFIKVFFDKDVKTNKFIK